jgi:hypothetical protein
VPPYDPAGCAALAFSEPIASNRAMTGPTRSRSELLKVLRAHEAELRAVRAFGNVLRYAYDQVDPTRIWEIATGDLPRMAAAAEAALHRLDKAQDSWRPRVTARRCADVLRTGRLIGIGGRVA